MSALDGSVVNIVLPVIRQAFQQDVAAVEWIITIYLLILSGLLLSFGRLGDLHGHKQVFLAGFGVFLVSSALCGLAPSVETLVVFRGIQALGAAMLSANSPAILTKSFPSSQRGQALGLQATMTYLGLTVGPSLGGWLTEQWGWRAVFYINIPVGLLAFLLGWHFIPSLFTEDRVEMTLRRFDWRGALLFMTGLIALLLGLNQGHAWGWISPAIFGSLALALILLIVFIYLEKNVTDPMLDLSLFRDHVFSLSVVSAILNYMCVYSITFLMPFYLIQGRQFLPSQAGLLLTAMPVIMAIAAPISGTLSDRIGVRLLSTLGMALLALGLFMLSRLNTESSSEQIILSLACAGLGIGIFISPNNSALMGSAPRHRQGIASGVLATARNVGMVLGVGFSGAIYTSLLVRDPGALSGDTSSVFTAIATSFLAAVSFALLGMVLSAMRMKSRQGVV